MPKPAIKTLELPIRLQSPKGPPRRQTAKIDPKRKIHIHLHLTFSTWARGGPFAPEHSGRPRIRPCWPWGARPASAQEHMIRPLCPTWDATATFHQPRLKLSPGAVFAQERSHPEALPPSPTMGRPVRYFCARALKLTWLLPLCLDWRRARPTPRAHREPTPADPLSPQRTDYLTHARSAPRRAPVVLLVLRAAPARGFPGGSVFSAPPAPCPRPHPGARRSTHRFRPGGASVYVLLYSYVVSPPSVPGGWFFKLKQTVSNQNFTPNT